MQDRDIKDLVVNSLKKKKDLVVNQFVNFFTTTKLSSSVKKVLELK